MIWSNILNIQLFYILNYAKNVFVTLQIIVTETIMDVLSIFVNSIANQIQGKPCAK